MAKTFKVNYPQPGTTIKAADFVAFGTVAQKKGKISGALLNKEGHWTHGQVLLGPPNWVVRFNNVPTGSYLLVVVYQHIIPEFAFVPFTVKSAKIMAATNIQTIYPLSGATVPDPFVAFGYSTGVTNIASTLTSETTGTVINGDPPLEIDPAWCIIFDVADDTYDLLVYDGDNSGGASCPSTGIIVEEEFTLKRKIKKKKKK